MFNLQTTQAANTPADVINFGLGQPALSLLPLKVMREAAAHRLGQTDPSLLAYGAEQGDGYFRLALAQFLSEGYGQPVDPAHLFVTNGASQGLDLICTLFAHAGDTVFVEEPSYFLALNIFADHHLNIVSLPIDEEGLIIEALEEKLKTQKPAFLYTIPTFHNPAGVTLSATRREQLVRLSETYGFLIVADEVYQLLGYSAKPPRPLPFYDEKGTVLSIGSFSKILAPGVRLGWIQAKSRLIERFVSSGLLDSGGGLNPFTSSLVRSALELGLLQEHLLFLKSAYNAGLIALSETLREVAPAFSFSQPEGGFFIWGHLAEDIDAEALLSKAKQHKVGFQPGIKFSSRQRLRNYMRLSFAYYDEAMLREGAKRLAKVITGQ